MVIIMTKCMFYILEYKYNQPNQPGWAKWLDDNLYTIHYNNGFLTILFKMN
jgi:hypothetical protein